MSNNETTMIMVFTGDGKGKTTAAIGQAVRALGHGKRVFMIQFIKSDRYPSGEDMVLPRIANVAALGGAMHFEKAGLGFVGILGDTLPFEEHCAAAKAALAKADAAMQSGEYDLVILDEVNVALGLKLLSVDEVRTLLDRVPSSLDVIFTGRNAHDEVLARADLATRCEEIRHPYRDDHASARKGVEF